jgi:hypothetical protein
VNPTLRAIDRLGSQRWFSDAVVLVIAVGILVGSALLSPSPDVVGLLGFDVPVVCGMRRLTGIPCPGCGLTRSFAFLAHGHLAESFHMNWLGPPLFLAVLAQVPWRLYRIARARTEPAAG